MENTVSLKQIKLEKLYFNMDDKLEIEETDGKAKIKIGISTTEIQEVDTNNYVARIKYILEFLKNNGEQIDNHEKIEEYLSENNILFIEYLVVIETKNDSVKESEFIKEEILRLTIPYFKNKVTELFTDNRKSIPNIPLF